MLKVCFDIIDGCGYGRQRDKLKYFKDEKELDEYESGLASGMYFMEINYKKEVDEKDEKEQ